jgi:uncharacterized protein (TIRG00374 family)
VLDGMSRRGLRAGATLVLTGLCTAYILWKIDLSRTGHLLAHARLSYFAAATAIWLVAVWPLAWRWQRLLAARGVRDDLGWLIRAYLVSYTAGQILPTSLGGDAARIYQGTRRHRGEGGAIAGSVLLERALGGTTTLALAALGFVLAVGRYDVGAYLWIELALVLVTVVGVVVLFSRRMRRPLARIARPLRLIGVERPVRLVYEGLHAYRRHIRLLVWTFALTLAVQAVRVAGIWLVGKSVGVDLSPRPYYVMGPMLFLVMLIPFTVSGLAVREAFFVSFLGQLHVSADKAFSTGFLFFVLSFVLAIPGAAVLAWEYFPGRADAKELEPTGRNPSG